MKLGISNIAWRPNELDEALDRMADAGARGLEIAPGLAFAAESDPFTPSPGAVGAFRRRLDARSVELISMQSLLYGVQGARLFGAPAEREAFEAGLARAIALAGALGIPNLVMGSPANRVIPESLDREQAVAQAADVFRRLGDLADAAGAVLALEPNPAAYGTNFLTTLREAAAFATIVAHPAVTVNFDLGALHMNGEIAQAGELYAGTGERVSHVHVSEPGLAPAPADADLFARVAEEILERGYDGWFSIEMRGPERDGLAAVQASLEACARGLARAEGSP